MMALSYIMSWLKGGEEKKSKGEKETFVDYNHAEDEEDDKLESCHQEKSDNQTLILEGSESEESGVEYESAMEDGSAPEDEENLEDENVTENDIVTKDKTAISDHYAKEIPAFDEDESGGSTDSFTAREVEEEGDDQGIKDEEQKQKEKTVSEDKEKRIKNGKKKKEDISDLKKATGQNHEGNLTNGDNVNKLEDFKNTKISEPEPDKSESSTCDSSKDICNHSGNQNSKPNIIYIQNNNLYEELEDDIPKLSNLAQEVLEVFHKKTEEGVKNVHNLNDSRTRAEETTMNVEIKSCKPTAIVKPCKISDEVRDPNDSELFQSDDDKLGKDKIFKIIEDVEQTEISKQPKETEYNIGSNIKEKENKIEKKDQKCIQRNSHDGISPNKNISEADTNITVPLPKHTHAELEVKLKSTDKEIRVTRSELDLTVENNNQMMIIVSEFEKTIGDLIKEKERETVCLDIQTERMTCERDEVVQDHLDVERAYMDLRSKYNRTMEVVAGFKESEDRLKQTVEELGHRHAKGEQIFNKLKEDSEQKLNRANDYLAMLNRSKMAEVAKLEARLRKAEMKTASLEQTIERQTSDNNELTKICDELIVKVGSK